MQNTIQVIQLHQELASAEPPAVVDVRSPAEFATGHIAGAINIPLDQLAVRQRDIPGARLVLVCERGTRAAAAQSLLLPCSPEARTLDGGMHAWRQAELPVIRVTRTSWSLERQVRLIAGALVLCGLVLGLAFTPWAFLIAAIPGAGLVLAGLTDLCPMGIFLCRMPWNRVCLPGTSVLKPQVSTDVK